MKNVDDNKKKINNLIWTVSVSALLLIRHYARMYILCAVLNTLVYAISNAISPQYNVYVATG